MIHSSWPDWGWELKETIKSGLTTIQKFRLTITNSDKIFSEDAVVWIVLNSQNQISKCEIYFDATQFSQIKKVITTRERSATSPASPTNLHRGRESNDRLSMELGDSPSTKKRRQSEPPPRNSSSDPKLRYSAELFLKKEIRRRTEFFGEMMIIFLVGEIWSGEVF